jgi:hypothetical protein
LTKPSPHHTLLARFALGFGLQDQRLFHLLAQLLEEKRQEAAGGKP